MMSEALIDLDNIKTWFPHQKTLGGSVTSWIKAVDWVTLKIFAGECIGLWENLAAAKVPWAGRF